jgi:hypothetical protein
VTIFGPAFSRELVDGCVSIEGPDGRPIPIEWALRNFAYESGFDLNVLVGHARLVPAGPGDDDGYPDQRPEVAGSGGLRLSHGTGARGLYQAMPRREHRADVDKGDPKKRRRIPDLLHLYAENRPEGQCRDAFAFWRAMIAQMKTGPIRSSEAFYCLNLLPAVLRGGVYDDETPVTGREGPYAFAWSANQRLAPLAPDGKTRISPVRRKHLAVRLDDAQARNRARFEEELSAAYAFGNLRPAS